MSVRDGDTRDNNHADRVDHLFGWGGPAHAGSCCSRLGSATSVASPERAAENSAVPACGRNRKDEMRVGRTRLHHLVGGERRAPAVHAWFGDESEGNQRDDLSDLHGVPSMPSIWLRWHVITRIEMRSRGWSKMQWKAKEGRWEGSDVSRKGGEQARKCSGNSAEWRRKRSRKGSEKARKRRARTRPLRLHRRRRRRRRRALRQCDSDPLPRTAGGAVSTCRWSRQPAPTATASNQRLQPATSCDTYS